MLNYSDLAEKFKIFAIDVYETNSTIHEIGHIEFDKLDDFVQFAKKNKIEYAFYNYIYISEENLKIDEDVVSKLNQNKDIYDILKNHFDEYNKKIEILDFSRPISLEICFAHQGIIYYLTEYDYWHEDEGFFRPEIAAMQIINDNLDEIVIKRNEYMEEIRREREKLKYMILNDENFRECSNAKMRKTYITNLVSEDKTIRNLFDAPERPLTDKTNLFEFVERIWKEYKESTKSK